MAERPKIGLDETVAPGIRRILAPNPSPMTHWGTNSYLIGEARVVLVDPGPDLTDHRDALLRAIGPAEVAFILVTHAHNDHSRLAPEMSERTGAPVLAFGAPESGRSEVMDRLAASGRVGGGEGVDHGFRPNQTLGHGDSLEVDGHRIEAIHTPGHFPGHLSFDVGGVLLSGDHVMDWSTTLISPPEGDVAAFLRSCDHLLELEHDLYLPAHGAPIQEPSVRVSALAAHRRTREEQILNALVSGPGTPDQIARTVYHDLAPGLLPAAARNVLAHLVDLSERGLVQADPEIGWDAHYRRA